MSTTPLPIWTSQFSKLDVIVDWIEWDYFIWKKNGRHSMKGKEKEMGSMTIILDSLQAWPINLALCNEKLTLNQLEAETDYDVGCLGFESQMASFNYISYVISMQ